MLCYYMERVIRLAAERNLQWETPFTNICEGFQPGCCCDCKYHLVCRRQEAIVLSGSGSVKGGLPRAAILRIIEGLMMANCTFPEATSQMAAGLSLANRFTGHRSDPCSRKLIRAWRYGQSLRLTSSAATSSINRDRVVCGWVRIRVGLKEISFELIFVPSSTVRL